MGRPRKTGSEPPPAKKAKPPTKVSASDLKCIQEVLALLAYSKVMELKGMKKVEQEASCERFVHGDGVLGSEYEQGYAKLLMQDDPTLVPSRLSFIFDPATGAVMEQLECTPGLNKRDFTVEVRATPRNLLEMKTLLPKCGSDAARKASLCVLAYARSHFFVCARAVDVLVEKHSRAPNDKGVEKAPVRLFADACRFLDVVEGEAPAKVTECT